MYRKNFTTFSFNMDATQQSKNQSADRTDALQQEGAFETSRSDANTEHLVSATTHATIDALAPEASISNFKPLSESFLKSSTTSLEQDVSTFLAKPLEIATGTLNTTDSFPATLARYRFPQDLIYSNPIWYDKIRGNFGFRGTANFTLQVNCTPFQAGRYILAWIPAVGSDSDVPFNLHVNTLTELTQTPHVEIDLNCDSEAFLKVPHINPFPYSYITNGTSAQLGMNGHLVFTPYSPLATGSGSNSATWAIFLHWTDVHLSFPIHPQSGIERGTRRKIGPAYSEQASQGNTPISSSLNVASTVASKLSIIPSLSSVMGTAKWYLDAASKSAASFGWSRPHNSESTSLMVRTIMNRFTNSDVADNSTKMAIFDNNEIENLPGFAGTDNDELSIAYLASISAWYGTLTWSIEDTVGTELLKKDLHPRAGYVNTSQSMTTLTHFTPLCWVASMFALYKGSIKYTFKLVKTDFHSGRLLVTFWPFDYYVNNVSPDPTVTGTSAYCYREIIDVRNGNEFSVIFPYSSTTHYRSTFSDDRVYGYFTLSVLTKLTAPVSVSSTIKVLVEISGHEDMEFAQPCNLRASPCYVVTPQSGMRNVCNIETVVAGNANIVMSDEPSRACIGERVHSLRTMLKRFTPVLPFGSLGALAKYQEIYPWAIDIGQIATITLLGGPPDTFSYIAPAFALFRGSMRWKFVNNFSEKLFAVSTFPVDQSDTPPEQLIPPYLGTRSYGGPYQQVGEPASIARTSATGGIEVDVPYYNRQPMTATHELFLNSASAGPLKIRWDTTSIPRSLMVFSNAGATWTDAPNYLRAMGEDASLGLFVSTVPYSGWTEAAH